MKPEDLRVESLSEASRGGQYVGVTQSNIKVTHIPTGITATCGSERSQHRCRTIAMCMVEYGLAEMGWRDA